MKLQWIEKVGELVGILEMQDGQVMGFDLHATFPRKKNETDPGFPHLSIYPIGGKIPLTASAYIKQLVEGKFIISKVDRGRFILVCPECANFIDDFLNEATVKYISLYNPQKKQKPKNLYAPAINPWFNGSGNTAPVYNNGNPMLPGSKAPSGPQAPQGAWAKGSSSITKK